MNKQREALKLALEALEKHGNSYLNHEDEYSDAINAIREALAEPDEPELICDKDPQGCWNVRCQLGKVCKNTAPPARKRLTEQQILELLPDAQHGWTTATYGKWVARAIERAHGIGD